jgi:hypothetical protein
MNDMSPPIGHNNAPDPLDEALAPYGDAISEAGNWLDGQAVTTEDQMKAVDALTKDLKAAKKAVIAAQKSESAPLHDAWKNALARYKPTIDDIDKQVKGLVGLVNSFKRDLAEKKRKAEREAWEAAEKARREAEAKAYAADMSNIEQQREAEAAKQEALEAEKIAQAAKRDTKSVKGLRTVHKYRIDDHRAALHDIAQNDRDALTAFIESYVAQNHRTRPIAGVETWAEKTAC